MHNHSDRTGPGASPAAGDAHALRLALALVGRLADRLHDQAHTLHEREAAAHVRYCAEDLAALADDQLPAGGPVGLQIDQNIEALLARFRELVRELPPADLREAVLALGKRAD